MNKQHTIAPLITLLLLYVVAGCSPVRVSYLGNDEGSTKKVTLYFDRSDLPAGHHIIGEMIATAPEEVNAEKMQKNIKREARQKGANGVLIEEFDVLINGSVVNEKGHHVHHNNDSHEEAFSGTYVKASLVTY